jgi:undecaprenyl-diphosphatase
MAVIGARRIDPWWLVAIACLAGFCLLAIAVNEQGSFAFDAPVIAFVQGLPVPTDAWLALTAAAGAILVPIGIVLVLALAATRRYRTAIVVALALLGAMLATELLKEVVSRPRPPGDPLAPARGFSFPSGHTLLGTVSYGLIALVVWRSHFPQSVRRAVLALLVALVIGIGLSRIALGVHYPSDVLAGALGGLAIVAVVAAITRPLDRAVEAPGPSHGGGP